MNTLDLLTVLMVYLLIVMPLHGAVAMYASTPSCFDKNPSEIRNESLPQSFEFEIGQQFEFAVYMPSSIGIILYKINRVLKDKTLVSSVFTYYTSIPGEDGLTILWNDPITIEENFWINDQTYQSPNSNYAARLWSTNLKYIIPEQMEHSVGENSQCGSPIAGTSLKKIDREGTNGPTIIRLIGQENVDKTQKTSKAAQIEENTLIYANKILNDINLPFRLVK